MAAWVCLDVGECLIDETRVWGAWADVLGVPRLTLGAVLGGVIERGGHDTEAFALLGRPDWADLGSPPPHRTVYVGDRVDNDVLPALAAGMGAIWLRRGPWGALQRLPPDAPSVPHARTLLELSDLLAARFASAPSGGIDEALPGG